MVTAAFVALSLQRCVTVKLTKPWPPLPSRQVMNMHLLSSRVSVPGQVRGDIDLRCPRGLLESGQCSIIGEQNTHHHQDCVTARGGNHLVTLWADRALVSNRGDPSPRGSRQGFSSFPQEPCLSVPPRLLSPGFGLMHNSVIRVAGKHLENFFCLLQEAGAEGSAIQPCTESYLCCSLQERWGRGLSHRTWWLASG